jgi:hypothetical protein
LAENCCRMCSMERLATVSSMVEIWYGSRVRRACPESSHSTRQNWPQYRFNDTLTWKYLNSQGQKSTPLHQQVVPWS